MREQKYKDILEKYEAEFAKATETENFKEEKLSMTREMKFKDLQDHLNNEKVEETSEDLAMTREMKFLDKVREASEAIRIENIVDGESALKESVLVERELDEAVKREEAKMREMKIKEVRESEEKQSSSKRSEDDIYLTTSFQPFRKRFRFRKVFKVLFALLFIVCVVGAFAYFVAYPVYTKLLDSRPKIIFDRVADSVSKELSQVVDHFYEDEYLNFDLNFTVKGTGGNSNTLGLRNTMQMNTRDKEFFLYIKAGQEEQGMSYNFTEEKKDVAFTNSNKVLDLSRLSEGENELEKGLLQYIDKLNLNKTDLNYILTKETEILKELMESDLIKTSKDEITVNGKNLKVTRHSLTIDKKGGERLSKKYYELVSEDAKLVQILATVSNTKRDEYLDRLEKFANKELDKEFKLVFSIYTIKGTQVVGFDFEGNGFRNIYYYSNSIGEFESYMNLGNMCEFIGKKCSGERSRVIEIVGEEKDNTLIASVKYNSKLYAKLMFNKEESASCEYEFYLKEKTFKGKVNSILKKMSNEGSNVGRNETNESGETEDTVVPFTENLFNNEYLKFLDGIEDEELKDSFELLYNVFFNIREIF